MDMDEIIEAQKSGKPIVDFFSGKPSSEIESLDEELKADLPNPLDFKALSEEMCAELAEAQNMADFWTERLKSLKDQAKRLAGKERGLLPYGAYAIEIKESKGRSTTDWKAYVSAMMTPRAVEEAQADPIYTKTGDPVISLSVKKLR